jgi:hypothetical protein
MRRRESSVQINERYGSVTCSQEFSEDVVQKRKAAPCDVESGRGTMLTPEVVQGEDSGA